MDKTKEPGYVYILTNPSFREDWVKIGKSSRPVDVRSKELDNTAVPLPFEIYATIKTVKYNEVEKHVHKTIDRLTDLRIRQNREFFNVAPQIALDIFYDIAKMIEDAVVTVYKDNKPVTNNEKPDEHVDDSDDSIEYEGRIYKLSPFVGTFMPEDKRNASGAYQGAKYFSYKGKVLDDLRSAIENAETASEENDIDNIE